MDTHAQAVSHARALRSILGEGQRQSWRGGELARQPAVLLIAPGGAPLPAADAQCCLLFCQKQPLLKEERSSRRKAEKPSAQLNVPRGALSGRPARAVGRAHK